MSKLTVAMSVACALMVASVAWATVSIDWYWDLNANQFVYQNDGSTLLPLNSIIQLIFSPTGVNTGPSGTAPLVPAVGNTVLASMPLNGIFGFPGAWNFGVANYPVPGVPGQYVGGYVFQRVFDTLWGNSPTDQSFYADGPMSLALANADGDPTPPADVSYFFASSGSGYVLSQRVTIIPEPTTWALMGIGALAMIIRRRRA